MTTSIDPSTIDWLLSGDPSIKWQVMKDLCSASPDEIEKERSRIELEGGRVSIIFVATIAAITKSV